MKRIDIITSDTVDIPDQTVRLLFGQIDYARKSLFWEIEEMTTDELDFRGPEGTLNSTAMLVRHLMAIELWWLHAFQKKPIPTEVLDQFGPLEANDGRIPFVSGLTAPDLLSQYVRVHAMLREYVWALTSADLDRVITLSDEMETTVRWGLWHLAEHSMLHQGQIRWLRAWSQ